MEGQDSQAIADLNDSSLNDYPENLAPGVVPEQSRLETHVRARPSARQVWHGLHACAFACSPEFSETLWLQRQRQRRKKASQGSTVQTAIPAAAVLLLGVMLVRRLLRRREGPSQQKSQGPDFSHLLQPCELASSAEHSEGSTALPLLGVRLAVSPL